MRQQYISGEINTRTLTYKLAQCANMNAQELIVDDGDLYQTCGRCDTLTATRQCSNRANDASCLQIFCEHAGVNCDNCERGACLNCKTRQGVRSGFECCEASAKRNFCIACYFCCEVCGETYCVVHCANNPIANGRPARCDECVQWLTIQENGGIK